MTRTEKLEELARAVDAWRGTRCSRPLVVNGEVPEDHASAEAAGEEFCDGANHLEDCPVELALQDVLEASNQLRRT